MFTISVKERFVLTDHVILKMSTVFQDGVMDTCFAVLVFRMFVAFITISSTDDYPKDGSKELLTKKHCAPSSNSYRIVTDSQ